MVTPDKNLDTLPYWLLNVSEPEREATCPPYLLNLFPKELSIISTLDSAYHILTWSEVRQVIADNALDIFQRKPSDLRRYLQYNHYLKQEYGSVMKFVLQERLLWTEPIVPEGKPFEKSEDVRILWNDWPYGVDDKIVHLVVWTKFELKEDPTTEDLTDEVRIGIERFVGRTFAEEVGKENVLWFKNWQSLKSVASVEHFHVMLYDPHPTFVKRITNGDVPLSQKL
ncbi:uncharacterized protein RAG0_02113 [Rhynchosporium agropyri]|uniref:N-acetylglucosamine-induced protein 1 n=1 Tax=Rhynchosporium agropyri TaxID=914238 RepID=A0A1E1K0H7_9HELO|nr:uncharacterized protein RAG0_02113 [Rhynchosporium agropyri]